jgi:D-beta-D-heptose 7-phosphate kinase/D-beta-D-heptose 1-phosphate adenosyltransferase
MITVIGDFILDIFEHGISDRISPEAPVPIIKLNKTEYAAGGAANVAQNLHSLGCKVNAIGIVGLDDEAVKLSEFLSSVYVSYVKDHNAPTITKKRLICNNQQIARIDKEERFENPINVENYCGEDTQYLVVSDYDKGTIGGCSESFKKLKKRGVKVLVDPKRDLYNYKHAWLVKPNKKEFKELVNDFKDYDDLIRKAILACKKYDFEYMLVTLGADGMILVSQQGEIVRQDSTATEVFDITGAGDSTLAGLVYGLVNNNDIIESLNIASKVAGIAVSHNGTYSVKESDIKEKIVFTNGCFDVLHLGHLKLLKFAKQQGDKLIVAINSDVSVKKLKGENRPKFNQDDRKAMLESLAIVDEVIVFDDDTPYELIKTIKPDVIVKGGDYTVETTVGHDLAEVVIFPRVKDYSTTKILEETK